tara:strand:+ start:1855 stop:2406 length:552 start_codon:yes stop_codon:yes gene_type:complete
MIEKFRPLLYRLEAWLLLAGLLALVFLLIGPRITGVHDQWVRLQKSETLALSHAEKLSRPAPPDRYARFRSFVMQTGPDTDTSVLAGSVQSSIIELVRTSKARLVDLRDTGKNTSIDGLIAITYHLEVEGDIQAALEVVSALGNLPGPILIDELDLKPAGGAGEPDRRIRLSMSLSLWTGDVQ